MTARLTANLVLCCAIGAVAAGCTVHTYSGRPEHAGTVFVSHGPRYEGSHRSERERASYRPGGYRREHDDSDVRERTVSRRDTTRREVEQGKDRDTDRATRTPGRGSSKPSRNDSAADKPRSGKDDGEHVVLMPTTPEKAKPARTKKRVSSFQERLEKLVDNKNKEVAQQERERRERMERAADKHN